MVFVYEIQSFYWALTGTSYLWFYRSNFFKILRVGPSRGVKFRFIKKMVGSGFRLGDTELLLGSDWNVISLVLMIEYFLNFACGSVWMTRVQIHQGKGT